MSYCDVDQALDSGGLQIRVSGRVDEVKAAAELIRSTFTVRKSTGVGGSAPLRRRGEGVAIESPRARIHFVVEAPQSCQHGRADIGWPTTEEPQ